ncbi:hypothetical protein COCON_G00035640 [Conger conger]|uniref:Uncharacterized protein n=1 Tax=Conger conger TaxID=82655 RepID=A0A9Q1I6S3_CONCO|nr:hypothetical protein COCON_G00035640 [Conger conger]
MKKFTCLTFDLVALHCEAPMTFHCAAGVDRARGPVCTDFIDEMDEGDIGEDREETAQALDSVTKALFRGTCPSFCRNADSREPTVR